MRPLRLLFPALAAAALALSACATSPYTGPVEVIRFVGTDRAALGQGPIHVYFPEEITNTGARDAIKAAVERELQALGYSIAAQEGPGVGMGVGINLGGGSEGPAANTELSVRINRPDGTSIWEGRAQIATGVKSPYSQVDTSARTLAAALFRDFPGGNGETVTIDVKKLQGTP